MGSPWIQWLRWLRALLLGWMEVKAWWQKATDKKASKGTRLAATLLLIIGLVFLWLSLRQPPQPIPPNLREIVVDLNENTTSSAEIAALEKRFQIDLEPNSPQAHRALLMVASVPSERMGKVLRGLQGEPDVEAAEPNYLYRLYWEPNDPLYAKQWNFRLVGMEEAWEVGRGEGVIVAVIDTGVAYEDYKEFRQASDLKGTQFVPGYNFVANNPHPNDDHGHGTHVAGTIAQTTNNGYGVAGIAFRCRIMPLKVLNRAGMGTLSDIADAIRFAADHGAQVINMSLGGPMYSRILENACKYAFRKGVTLVCAAGNESTHRVSYPARFGVCLGVGAVGPDKRRAFYSNYGEGLDLVAPGGNKQLGEEAGILQNTVLPGEGDGFYWFQGTSMAAPHVAGVAALVIGLGVREPEKVRQILLETASPVGSPEEYGAGLLNAAAAVRRAKALVAGQRLAETPPSPQAKAWAPTASEPAASPAAFSPAAVGRSMPWIDLLPLGFALLLPLVLVSPKERRNPKIYVGILLGFGLLLIWRRSTVFWDSFSLWRWLRDLCWGGVGAWLAFGLLWGVRPLRPLLLGYACLILAYWLTERLVLWGDLWGWMWWGLNVMMTLALLHLAGKERHL